MYLLSPQGGRNSSMFGRGFRSVYDIYLDDHSLVELMHFKQVQFTLDLYSKVRIKRVNSNIVCT